MYFKKYGSDFGVNTDLILIFQELLHQISLHEYIDFNAFIATSVPDADPTSGDWQ